MKKIVLLICLMIIHGSLIAQDVATIDSSAIKSKGWTDETKMWMLIIFAVLSVIVVLRTFRNKEEV